MISVYKDQEDALYKALESKIQGFESVESVESLFEHGKYAVTYQVKVSEGISKSDVRNFLKVALQFKGVMIANVVMDDSKGFFFEAQYSQMHFLSPEMSARVAIAALSDSNLKLIQEFNDLYKRVIRIGDPEAESLAEVRRLVMTIYGLVVDLYKAEIIPESFYADFAKENRKRIHQALIYDLKPTSSWSDLVGDPLEQWRYYQDSLIRLVKKSVQYLKPAPSSFKWQGFQIFNPSGISEPPIDAALDALSEGLNLLKRRGLESVVTDNLTSITLAPAGFAFQGASGKSYVSVGNYRPFDKTMTLVISNLNKASGNHIKRWFTEVFLHELGHHIHLNYITPEAKKFWDSGWDIVQQYKNELLKMNTISLEDILGFIKALEATPNLQAVGKTLKGFDRAKYMYWLQKMGLSSVFTQVRPTKLGKSFEVLIARDVFQMDHTDAVKAMLEAYREFGYPVRKDLPDYILDYMDEGGGPLDSEMSSKLWGFLTASGSIFDEGRREIAYVKSLSHLGAKLPSVVMKAQAGADITIQKSVNKALEDLGIPSNYGKEDFQEDFAETFVLFVAAPDRLSKTARWRMGRTLGLSEAGGKKVMRLSKKIALSYLKSLEV